MKCISFHGVPSNLPYNLERLRRAWWQVILKQPASCLPAQPSLFIHIQCGEPQVVGSALDQFLCPKVSANNSRHRPQTFPLPARSHHMEHLLLCEQTWGTCTELQHQLPEIPLPFHEVGREQMHFSDSFPSRSTSHHGQMLVLFPRGKSMFAYL